MTPTLQRILVVEDEDDIREIVTAALEALGDYTVHPCASGNEAIKSAAAFNPDVVLLDVMMPGMDGPTTLGKLREIAALEKTPAIFLTAKAMPAEIEHYQSLGALGVIVKPFNPTSICQEIETLWDAFHSS
jgi:two-component system, OmpR family, response regulator